MRKQFETQEFGYSASGSDKAPKGFLGFEMEARDNLIAAKTMEDILEL